MRPRAWGSPKPEVVAMTRPQDIPLRELLARLVRAGPTALDDLEALRLAAGLSAAEAFAVVEEFGSLPEVLAADPAALERRLSRAKAARLGLARDLTRRELEAPLRQRPLLASRPQVARYLAGVLRGRPRAQLRGLFLDRRARLIRDEPLGEGTVDHVPVYPREVLRRALELNASALLLAQNHPDGSPAPSDAEVAATREVVAGGRALRIAVHDHLLLAGDEVVSFRDLGLL